MVLSLLQDKTGKTAALATALMDAADTVRPCPICGILTDIENTSCEFCRDAARANGQLCIVRGLEDVWTLEKSGVFRGRYHILGGQLSGMNGVTPDDLNIGTLSPRISAENISEIIFALPNTVEGKTTQHYVMSVINNPDIAFSELASGVPLGGDLDYLDDGTLSLAFGGRKAL
jgi:recombination protein RecR